MHGFMWSWSISVGKQGRLVGAWSMRTRVWRADKAVSHDVTGDESRLAEGGQRLRLAVAEAVLAVGWRQQINGSVIVSLLLAERLGWVYADPLFGGAIAVYILFNAWAIARGALDMLMDREMPDADRTRIRELALAHPEVRDMHDLRTRLSGPYAFIQLHLEMDGDLRLLRAHGIANQVEANIVAAFPGAEGIIHEDPEGVPEPHRDNA